MASANQFNSATAALNKSLNKHGGSGANRTANASPMKMMHGAMMAGAPGMSVSAAMAAQIMENGKLNQQQSNNTTRRIDNLDLFMKDQQQMPSSG